MRNYLKYHLLLFPTLIDIAILTDIFYYDLSCVIKTLPILVFLRIHICE